MSAEQWASIQGLGLDVASVEERPEGIEVQLVLYAEEEGALRSKGIDLRPVRNEAGLTQTEAATRQSVQGFDVWRSFDEPGGIEDQIRAIASDPKNRSFVQLVDLGVPGDGWPAADADLSGTTDWATWSGRRDEAHPHRARHDHRHLVLARTRWLASLKASPRGRRRPGSIPAGKGTVVRSMD